MRLGVTLSGLEAFEAAARLGSIGRAADELGVTASAVSHRIAALERRLGLRLFLRERRGLAPTREGAAFGRRLRPAFRLISRAVDEVFDEVRGPLRLSVLETFALYWLMPRLKEAGGLDLAIQAGQELAAFDAANVDAAVRLGDGRWDGLVADKLFDETVALFARRDAPPPARLFLSRHREQDWAEWRARCGGAPQAALPVSWVDSSALSIKAAADGAGYCLASVAMTESEVAAGRLGLAHAYVHPSGRGAYWLVYPRLSLRDVRLRAFRSWLLDSAAAGEAAA
ncbi:MAG TPA: LysR substrate-binding domain-containing protein [Allosphingosinicella sp.]|nr:LysR substrate-binding domain-containing protein [Allosphingosinicella sp.]